MGTESVSDPFGQKVSEDNGTRCLRLAGELDKDELIGLLLVKIAKMRKPRDRTLPLWSIVGEVTNHGSGVSSAICTLYGVNPDWGNWAEIDGGKETPSSPSKPIGQVRCSWCHWSTPVKPTEPPFTIRCAGCKRLVRVEKGAK
jgi:hypothetical protein